MEMLQAASIRSSVLEGHSALAQTLWMLAFAGATAVGAQIEIPHQPVPYTLQTFFVLLAGALLGKRNGALSQLMYLAAGAAGLPVFSHWGYGLAKLAGPTGGYLIGFPIAAFVVGYLVQRNRSILWTAISMTVGLLTIFSLGTLQLFVFYDHDFADAFRNGFLIFSFWDMLKLGAAVLVRRRLLQRAPGQS